MGLHQGVPKPLFINPLTGGVGLSPMPPSPINTLPSVTTPPSGISGPIYLDPIISAGLPPETLPALYMTPFVKIVSRPSECRVPFTPTVVQAAGEGQEVRLGTIDNPAGKKEPKENQDQIDRSLRENPSATANDIISEKAQDFYDGLKRIYESCVEKARQSGVKEADLRKTCCIKKIIIAGHWSAGIGGREGLDKLSAQQWTDMSSWLCKDVAVRNIRCCAFDVEDIGYVQKQLGVLISSVGGFYQGYKGETSIKWGATVKPGSYDPFDEKFTIKPRLEPGISTVVIPKGTSEADILKKFEYAKKHAED